MTASWATLDNSRSHSVGRDRAPAMTWNDAGGIGGRACPSLSLGRLELQGPCPRAVPPCRNTFEGALPVAGGARTRLSAALRCPERADVNGRSAPAGPSRSRPTKSVRASGPPGQCRRRPQVPPKSGLAQASQRLRRSAPDGSRRARPANARRCPARRFPRRYRRHRPRQSAQAALQAPPHPGPTGCATDDGGSGAEPRPSVPRGILGGQVVEQLGWS